MLTWNSSLFIKCCIFSYWIVEILLCTTCLDTLSVGKMFSNNKTEFRRTEVENIWEKMKWNLENVHSVLASYEYGIFWLWWFLWFPGLSKAFAAYFVQSLGAGAEVHLNSSVRYGGNVTRRFKNHFQHSHLSLSIMLLAICISLSLLVLSLWLWSVKGRAALLIAYF